MGRLHARIYSQMPQVEFVGVVDIQREKAEALAAEYGTRAYTDPAEVLDRLDAVTVAVPTEAHLTVAAPFLSRSIPVLVEKPLAVGVHEARRMLELAQQHRCLLQVGYSERFNPVVQALRRLNVAPRFLEAVRISPYTFRSTDVGVVLDLMIHDIDIMLSLAHSEVAALEAVGVSVVGRHEDIANARLTFANGFVANLTASRLALKTERKVRVFSEEAYLSLDYLKKSGLMVRKAANIDMVQWLRQQQARHGDLNLLHLKWQDLVRVETLDIDDREPLVLEQEAFLQAVRDGSRPQVSAEDAIAAMELAERIVAKIKTHGWSGGAATLAPAVEECRNPQAEGPANGRNAKV